METRAVAEQSVLGAMLLDEDAARKAITLLDETMFSRVAHRLLFQAMCAVMGRNEIIDPVTLGDELERRDALARAGGMEYIGALIDVVPSGANIAAYCRIVRAQAERRPSIEKRKGKHPMTDDDQEFIDPKPNQRDAFVASPPPAAEQRAALAEMRRRVADVEAAMAPVKIGIVILKTMAAMRRRIPELEAAVADLRRLVLQEAWPEGVAGLESAAAMLADARQEVAQAEEWADDEQRAKELWDAEHAQQEHAALKG